MAACEGTWASAGWPLPSTQATAREAAPFWQADQAPVRHMAAGHGAAVAHGCDAAGASAGAQPLAHRPEPAASACSPSMHCTARVAVPEPHVAEQSLHSDTAQWQPPHLLCAMRVVLSRFFGIHWVTLIIRADGVILT